jgi:hypothetical protein
MRFRCFTATSLAGPWAYRERLEPVSWRAQARGLGSASIRVLQGVGGVPGANEWLTIVDTDGMADPLVFEPVADQARIEWAGFVSTAPSEVFAGGARTEGFIEGSELGFYFASQPIIRNFAHPGYNPTLDGEQRGNALRVSPGQQPGLRRSLFGVNKATEADKFWTTREIIDDILPGMAVPIISEWNTDAPIIGEIPESPSYEGSSLIDLLDDLLSPLSYVFRLGDSSGQVTLMVYAPYAGEAVNIDLSTVPVRRFMVTAHEDGYQRIVLRGNRVRSTFSLSTYGPATLATAPGAGPATVCPIAKPAWSIADMEAYLAGHPIFGQRPNNTAIRQWVIDNFAASLPQDEPRREQEIQATIRSIIRANEEVRAEYPDVYSRFLLDFDAAGCLWTMPYPGLPAYDGDTAVRPFPKLRFQAPDTGAIYAVPEVIPDQHSTPDPLSWVQHDLTSARGYDGRWLPPTWWYRSVARIDAELPDTPDGEPFRQQVWVDGSLSAEGYASGEVTVDGTQIILRMPYPEQVASGSDSIFADRDQSSDWTFADYGVQRGEWGPESSYALAGLQGASARNPDQEFFLDKGHWSRIVVTLCVETSQYAEWSWTQPGTAIERVKLVTDDTLDCWVTAPGAFAKTAKTEPALGPDTAGWAVNFPYYETDSYRFDRYSGLEAEALLLSLRQWYNRARNACSLEVNVFGAPGEPHPQSPAKVGDFIGVFTEGGLNTVANSAVASVEVQLGDSPTRTITTEIPAAPPLSRFRRLYAP